MRWLFVSAMYTLPAPSYATPLGPLRDADVAAPPSLEVAANRPKRPISDMFEDVYDRVGPGLEEQRRQVLHMVKIYPDLGTGLQ